jgi:hypothetical protein
MRTMLFVTLVGLLGSACAAQDSITIASDPKDLSRPISTLLDQLRKNEKISVTYEDPRYVNAADLQDVTSKAARNMTPLEKKSSPPILVPKGKPITFVYYPQDIQRAGGADATIERLLREYDAAGGPTFTVRRDGIWLHVLPSKVLNAKGELVGQDSILDVTISIPPAQRDGGELLQAICDQVQKQTGYEIGVGPSAPGNSLARYKTAEGVDHQSALTALEHLLDSLALPGSFVWDLYYGPDVKAYALNFAYIGPAKTPPRSK